MYHRVWLIWLFIFQFSLFFLRLFHVQLPGRVPGHSAQTDTGERCPADGLNGDGTSIPKKTQLKWGFPKIGLSPNHPFS